MQFCKTCKYLDVPPNKAGRIVPQKKYTYRCLAPEPPMPILPTSITSAYGFSWPPHRRFVRIDEGTECPVYEQRQKEEKR